MSLVDVAAQNASLDNDYGATKGPNAAASHLLALYDGDPTDDGVELDATGGYARVSLANDGTVWPAAANGEKVSVEVTLTGTATYGSPATHWGLIDAADGVTLWDSGEFDLPVEEPTDTVTLTVFYGQRVS